MMQGSFNGIVRGMDGKYILSIAVDGDPRQLYETLKDFPLDIDIRKHRKHRSLDANAYFHVLVNKIAAATNNSDSAVKKRLVQEYGTVARDADGGMIGFKLPTSVDVDQVCDYTRWFDKREEGGHWFNCYLLLKPTHEMNSKEFARVVEGAVTEAKELGIETLPPREIEAMIGSYHHERG